MPVKFVNSYNDTYICTFRYVDIYESVAPSGGFLTIISVGIPTYTGMKTGFYAHYSQKPETGFHGGIDK